MAATLRQTMRIARNLAVLVALATVGFALGDWASHPNALGVLGILGAERLFALPAVVSHPAGARAAARGRRGPEGAQAREARGRVVGLERGRGAVAREQRRERR